MSLITFALAAALAGQDPGEVSRHCLDDDHTNRCDAEVQAGVRALLGVASIEDEASTGAEVYRAFFVDGYGLDRPAVSFERRPNEPPKVVVYGIEGRRQTGPLSMQVWETVMRRSLFAEAAPPPSAPLPADPDLKDEVVVCVHAWVSTFEATVTHEGAPQVRQRTENGCLDGLTTAYAFELAALAVASLPACERLKPENHRNDIARLEACLILEGDTIAAADLLNDKDDPPRSRRGEAVTAEAWREWLGSGHAARIEWAGEVFAEARSYPSGAERRDLSQFLVQREMELGSLQIYPVRYVGEGKNRALIKGQIAYLTGESSGGEHRMVADYSQIWFRMSDGPWRLDSWTVGAFTRHDDPEN